MRDIDVEEFVRRLRAETNADKRFALFLGAGCSVSSGIPAAGALVRDRWIPRLRDFKAPHRSDLDTWAREVIQDYDPDNAALSYGKLIDRLFLTPDDRQREIEDLCDGRTPSFGYAVLAQLIARPEGRFNIVLTTNFDDLIADALYLYTEARPLVIHHESLAAYIRPTRTRPLIVKLHGDHRLSPRNTALETQTLEQGIQRQTAMVLHDRGVIFMGYGGADEGILKLLDELPPEALPYGAYWVHPEEPQGKVREWLLRRHGVWVRSGWFDEVMLLIRNAFELPHPSADRFHVIFRNYQDKFQELFASIQKKPAEEPGVQALQKALTETEALFPDYWKAVREAFRFERNEPDRAEEIYQQGLVQFPQAAPLLRNYANFLKNVRKDHDAAEATYKRAIEAEPKYAYALVNYAGFLEEQRKDYDAAEAMYKRAIEADPKYAYGMVNYAEFLENQREDYDAAEAMYKRAIEAEPKYAYGIVNYADFLEDRRKDYDAAEAMYKRAIEADPKYVFALANYADFLEDQRKDYDAAETMHKRAIEADPKHANALGRYAFFLEDRRKDYDAAEAMYKRAIEADPKYVNALVNYADLLENQREDYDAAEEMYKRAIEVDPQYAYALVSYAEFLENQREDYDAAGEMYKRAIEADPEYAYALEKHAIFLENRRKNYDDAEEMYKRAIEADPTDASTHANLAGLLLAKGKADGMAVLHVALELLRRNRSSVAELECAFYLFAYGPEPERAEGLKSVRRLLESDVRSPARDLSRNVERAQQNGHPEGAWLGKLAAVINDEAQPEVLDGWAAWQSAASS